MSLLSLDEILTTTAQSHLLTLQCDMEFIWRLGVVSPVISSCWRETDFFLTRVCSDFGDCFIQCCVRICLTLNYLSVEMCILIFSFIADVITCINSFFTEQECCFLNSTEQNVGQNIEKSF